MTLCRRHSATHTPAEWEVRGHGGVPVAQGARVSELAGARCRAAHGARAVPWHSATRGTPLLATLFRDTAFCLWVKLKVQYKQYRLLQAKHEEGSGGRSRYRCRALPSRPGSPHSRQKGDPHTCWGRSPKFASPRISGPPGTPPGSTDLRRGEPPGPNCFLGGKDPKEELGCRVSRGPQVNRQGSKGTMREWERRRGWNVGQSLFETLALSPGLRCPKALCALDLFPSLIVSSEDR
ncbi:hypothetical protein Z043_120924 [Scleropages formosus]|uniref:Uncharacterized protein n=1 Tax=Scleropages formosus TaxID=113540 RepID=A0A0N8JWI4_SCLFO|nr:hypothetical protein Z043_120924 [Scleropages formosus]